MADSAGSVHDDQEADQIRSIERERLRALVSANMTVANQLHANDFQLISPGGLTLSKEQYLGGISSGEINYLLWEPDAEIQVRLYGPVALIRYQSQIKITSYGQEYALRCWHTDAYEKRGGRWQVVWSQATAIE